MFNKMKYDRVQMCFSDVRLETQAAAAAIHWAGGGGLNNYALVLMLQRADCEFMTQKCVLFMA